MLRDAVGEEPVDVAEGEPPGGVRRERREHDGALPEEDAPGQVQGAAVVARDRVRSFEIMVEQAQLEIAQARAEAIEDIDAFRADYPWAVATEQMTRPERS